MKKLLLCSAALICTAAVAQAPVDSPAAQVREGESDQNQIVCRNEAEIGSRVSRRRVCRTRAEWRELSQMNRDTVDRVQMFKPCRIGTGAQAEPC